MHGQQNIKKNIVIARRLYLFHGLKVTSKNNLTRLQNTQPHNLYETVYVNGGIYDGVGTLSKFRSDKHNVMDKCTIEFNKIVSCTQPPEV